MEPVVLALENKYRDKMDFVIADVTTQDGGALGQKFDIYYIPVFFILDGRGNIINRIEYANLGGQPEATLDGLIRKALGGK